MDQSMVARFKKAAERQNEILSGGNIFEREERKKKLEEERDFLLKRDRQAQENDLAKQELVNAGQLADTETVNAGAMARQKLIEDTKRAEDLNNYNLGVFETETKGNVERFNAQTTRGALDLENRIFDWQAKQPEKGFHEKEMEVAGTILKDNTDPNSPQARWAMRILQGGQRNTVPQTANPETQPAKKQFVSSTSFDNNKDTAIPQQSKGVQSMTFDTNMGTAGKSPERFRAETEDLYYRLNPQLKKKRDTLFGS